MRNILVLFILVFLGACVSNSITNKDVELVGYVNHDLYGEVESKDARYKSDQDECESLVYKDGIELDGDIIKSRKTLFRMSFNHYKQYADLMKYVEKDSAVIAKKYEESDIPEHIRKIKALNGKYNECTREKGWSPGKLIYINRNTGEVVRELKTD